MDLGAQFKKLFHGTVNPEWNQAQWVHLGDRDAAMRRLHAVTDPGSFDRADRPLDPKLFSVTLRPNVRVAPHTEAIEDEDTGMWMDLGHRQTEGTWEPSNDFDVYPYENVDEGGTSFLVRKNAVGSFKEEKQ